LIKDSQESLARFFEGALEHTRRCKRALVGVPKAFNQREIRLDLANNFSHADRSRFPT